MRKQLWATVSMTVLVALLSPAASIAGTMEPQAVEIQFIASGPVLGVHPAGYDGEGADNPLNGQEVKLQFQKKSHGKWVIKKSRTETIDTGLVFGDPTPTYGNGKCRIKAVYAGDASYEPATATNMYTCDTGNLIYP